MLTVKRRAGEAIVIGENIIVTVEALEGKQVLIRVTAPEGVRVDREEVAFRRVLNHADLPLEVRP